MLRKVIPLAVGAALVFGSVMASAANLGVYRIVVGAVSKGLPMEAKLYSGGYDGRHNCMPNNKVFVYLKKGAAGVATGDLWVKGAQSSVLNSGNCMGLVVYNPSHSSGYEYCRASWPASSMKALLAKGGTHTDQVVVYKVGAGRGVCSFSFDVPR